MATKKTSTKSAAPAKKSAVKKSTASASTKAAATPAPAKKAARKTAAPKPATAKKATELTTVVAHIDIGWGNSLYLRGEGGGLSWEKGTLMDWVDGTWTWSTTAASKGLVFKFLVNDEIWSAGEDLSVHAGGTSASSPSF